MGNKGAKQKHLVLTEDEIDAIEANTNLSRDQIIQWHNNFMRDCPDGLLDKKQFAAQYDKMYPQGKGGAYAAAVFDVFDEDNNNQIDFNEFMIALTMTGRKDAVGKIKLAFQIYDVDKNGTIEKKELEKLLNAIYKLTGNQSSEPIKAKAKRVFSLLDDDNNGRVTEFEFISNLSQDSELMRMLAPASR